MTTTQSVPAIRVLLGSADPRTILHWRTSLETIYQVELAKDLDTIIDRSRADPIFSLIIIDHTLLADDFTGGLSRLQQSAHDVKILLIGRKCPREIQLEAFSQGIPGYIEADQKKELLQKSVDCLLNGEVWVERQMVTALLEVLRKKKSQQPEHPSRGDLACLTPREIEIAKRVCEGDSNKRIASRLEITERTVKAHLSSIFRKLEVMDRLQLALQLRDSFSNNSTTGGEAHHEKQ